MTIAELNEETEGAQCFRLKQARTLAGPGVVDVLALFMGSTKPVCSFIIIGRIFKHNFLIFP